MDIFRQRVSQRKRVEVCMHESVVPAESVPCPLSVHSVCDGCDVWFGVAAAACQNLKSFDKKFTEAECHLSHIHTCKIYHL
jgi:hypothetical protein